MKVCIVGCGAVAPNHAEAVACSEFAELYAVCDIDKVRADKFADKYNVKAYYDFDIMLEDAEVDSVHICTPHFLHKDMAVKAMRKGKNVVLEKPAAMNDEEFTELLNVKTQMNANVCLMLQNRTNTAVECLKRIVDDGEYGKLIGMEGSLLWSRDADYYASDEWRGKWATEGGALMINQAVHILDLFVFLAGNIKSVRASISAKQLGNVIEAEDTCDALFEMENGICANFYAANTHSVNKPMRIELQFEKVLFRYADSRLYKITDDACEIISTDNTDAPGKIYWGVGHTRVINGFYSALSMGKGRYITLEDGINSSRALFAIYRSGKDNGKEIVL